jgi:poly-gamma-glutamate synthesis protein (capsule biosynthesis protein)
VRRILFSSLIIIGLAFLSQANPDPPKIELAFLGDVMLGRGIQQANQDSKSMAASLEYLTPHLRQADLALVNLESPITEVPLLPESKLDLRASPAWVPVLHQSGLDVVNLINNHAMDSGKQGLIDTQANLIAGGLQSISPDSTPQLITVSGVRIAMLGFVGPLTAQSIETAVSAVEAAHKNSDFVIVSLHWGTEFTNVPTQSQRKLAQQLADAGADILWGHHPHVLQPVELITGEGRTSPTLVMYSLGNALFDQAYYPHATEGALIQVTLNITKIIDVDAVPFMIDVSQGKIIAPDMDSSEQIIQKLGISLDLETSSTHLP